MTACQSVADQLPAVVPKLEPKREVWGTGMAGVLRDLRHHGLVLLAGVRHVDHLAAHQGCAHDDLTFASIRASTRLTANILVMPHALVDELYDIFDRLGL